MRRVHILLLSLGMLMFGVMFAAADCSYCIGFNGITVCGGGGPSGGGGGSPPPPPPPPTSTPAPPVPTPTPNWTLTFELRLGIYSYGSSNCSDPVDPITLVVRMLGEPVSHFIDHGLPVDVNHDTGTQYYAYVDNPNQYFRDNAGCSRNEIDQASNNGYQLCWEIPPICTQSRWHARGHKNSLVDPQFPGLRDYAMTPHYDEAVSCGHAVPGDFFNNGTGWSGFDEARERTTLAWLNSGHHMMIDSQFWGNIAPRQQCNQTVAHANGYVYHIGMCGDIVSIPC